jgi:hypothetical protein
MAWLHKSVLAVWLEVDKKWYQSKGEGTHDWVVSFNDDTRIIGMPGILQEAGRLGWELVSVVPEKYSETQSASRYRLFFKLEVR